MMRRKRRLRMLVVVLGTAFLLAEPGTLDVLAHDFDAPSTIRLQASKKRIKRGKRVVLSGKVTSPQSECLGGREVTVAGSRKSAKTTTGSDGSYSVTFRLRKTSRFVATAVGSASGTHPHRHVCGGDISSSVQVKVKRRR